MADYHLSLWEEMERLTQEHTQCSISGQEIGDEETRSTNVATAMEKTAGEAAVELEEIPSHSSNMKIFVEDSGPGGCSSRLNDIPRKYQRRRKEDLPGEGIEPAIGTPGKHFSNPEVNTKSSETKNLPHHPPDKPTTAVVNYIGEEPEPSPAEGIESIDDTWCAEAVWKAIEGAETGNNRLSSIYSRFLGFGQTVVDE